MAATITNTPAVSAAIADAQNLPALVNNLSAIDPALAQQLTGKALVASKSVYGPVIAGAVALGAAHYGLNWSQESCDLVAGVVILGASAFFRCLTSGPITSWFVQKTTAPEPASPSHP